MDQKFLAPPLPVYIPSQNRKSVEDTSLHVDIDSASIRYWYNNNLILLKVCTYTVYMKNMKKNSSFNNEALF